MNKMKLIWLQILIVFSLFMSVTYAEIEEHKQVSDIFLYKTIPGDSLWNISQRHLHNISLWTELKKINQLPNDDYIEPGTLIKVPRQWLKVNQSAATLVHAVGEVKIINNHEQILILDQDFTNKDNLILTAGDTVITGEGGLATILFKDGSRLLVQSDSKLILNDLIALGDGSLSDIKLQLEKGRLENRVYSSPISNTNYEVKTATATTSVRGTIFRMGLENDNSVTEVVKGKVVAKSQEGAKNVAELLEGQAIIIEKDGETKHVEMLAAPEFNNFPQLIESVPIRIEVTPVENIVGYSTKIIPVGTDEHEAVSSVRSEGNVLLGDDLSDGRYTLITSAIDQYGVTGQPATYEFILNARPFAAELIAPTQEEKILLKNLEFHWQKVNDEASKYYLQVSKDDIFRDIVIDADNLTESTYKPENLLSGIYFWRVASIDDNGKRGPFSPEQSFRVLLEDPYLEKSKIKRVDIELEWAPLEEGTQYKIQISNSTDFAQVLVEQQLAENHYYVEDLSPGTYYFRVQSTAKDGYISEWGLPHKFDVLDIESISEKIQK